MSITKYVLLALVFFVEPLMLIYAQDRWERNTPNSDKHHVGVIDVGSTSTTIKVYCFTTANKLCTEGRDFYSYEIKPALISDHCRPETPNFDEAINKYIRNMTSIIDIIVRKDINSDLVIPFYLGATAGLRQESEINQENVMSKIQMLMPFLEKGEVLSGKDEGKCEWLTMNFLAFHGFLKGITPKDRSQNIQILEMGGGSLQYTSTGFDWSKIFDFYSDFDNSKSEPPFNDTNCFFSRSFPMGREKASVSVLAKTSFYRSRIGGGGEIARSYCLPNMAIGKLKYAGSEVIAGGYDGFPNKNRFEKCSKEVRESVAFQTFPDEKSFFKPILSAYYDHEFYVALVGAPVHFLQTAGIMDDTEKYKKFSFHDLKEYAKQSCINLVEYPRPLIPIDQNKLLLHRDRVCLDLVILYTLLQQFGFADNKWVKFLVYNKNRIITTNRPNNNANIAESVVQIIFNWALGYALRAKWIQDTIARFKKMEHINGLSNSAKKQISIQKHDLWTKQFRKNINGLSNSAKKQISIQKQRSNKLY